jgi:hypothetical protein
MTRMTRRLLAGVAALALLVPVVPGAAQGPRPRNDVRLEASPNPVTFGRTTQLSGRVTGRDHGGVRVELQENPFPYTGGFRAVEEVTSAANGEFTFTRRGPRVNTRYRALARTSPPATSPELPVMVAPRVTLAPSDRTPRRGQRVIFSGTVSPQHDGRLVHIQRRVSPGVYRTVARTVLADSGDLRSTFTRPMRIFRSGIFRAQVRGHSDHSTGTSRVRSVRVGG